MIYTILVDTLPKLENGKFPGSVNYHEAGGGALQSAHRRARLRGRAQDSLRRVDMAGLSADVCHPTPKGYESYNRDIDSALAALLEVKSAPANPLPPPLTPDLVVYPPPAKATPQPTPEPLLNEQGVPAKETDELPLFGQEWIGSNLKISDGQRTTLAAAVLSTVRARRRSRAPRSARTARGWKPQGMVRRNAQLHRKNIAPPHNQQAGRGKPFRIEPL